MSARQENPPDCKVYFYPKREKISEIRPDLGVSVPLARIRSDNENRFSIMFAREYENLLSKFQLCESTFGDWFNIQRGVQPYGKQKHTKDEMTSRFLHASTRLNDSYMPELQGEELSRYFVEPNRTSYLEYSDRLASSRPIENFTGERLVLRRLLTRKFRLQASYVNTSLITTDNILSVVPLKDDLNVLYALGILNSKIISWYYTGLSMVAQKDDFPQVHISALKSLPFPLAEKAQHDQVVNLVEKMLSLKQRQANTNDALNDQRHELQEQIQYLDQQIDRLVYQLYDLTEEEIRVVEGA